MSNRCSILGCKSNDASHDRKEAVTAFPLPKEEPLRFAWLSKIPTDLSRESAPVICTEHFEKAQIIEELDLDDIEDIVEIKDKVLKLKEGAVPSIFPTAPLVQSLNKRTFSKQNDLDDKEHDRETIAKDNPDKKKKSGDEKQDKERDGDKTDRMDSNHLNKKVCRVDNSSKSTFNIDGIIAEMIIEVDSETNYESSNSTKLLPSPIKEVQKNVAQETETKNKDVEVANKDEPSKVKVANKDEPSKVKVANKNEPSKVKVANKDEPSKVKFANKDEPSKVNFAKTLGLMRPSLETDDTETIPKIRGRRKGKKKELNRELTRVQPRRTQTEKANPKNSADMPGIGMKLSSISEFSDRVRNMQGQGLRPLYRILYFGLPSDNSSDTKRKILQFSGFPFDEKSPEFVKRKQMLKQLPVITLKNLIALFGMKFGPRLKTIDNLLKFLLEPTPELDPEIDLAMQPVVNIIRTNFDKFEKTASGSYIVPSVKTKQKPGRKPNAEKLDLPKKKENHEPALESAKTTSAPKPEPAKRGRKRKLSETIEETPVLKKRPGRPAKFPLLEKVISRRGRPTSNGTSVKKLEPIPPARGRPKIEKKEAPVAAERTTRLKSSLPVKDEKPADSDNKERPPKKSKIVNMMRRSADKRKKPNHYGDWLQDDESFPDVPPKKEETEPKPEEEEYEEASEDSSSSSSSSEEEEEEETEDMSHENQRKVGGRPYGQYTDELLEKVLTEIKERKISRREAQRMYGINRHSLSSMLKNREEAGTSPSGRLNNPEKPGIEEKQDSSETSESSEAAKEEKLLKAKEKEMNKMLPKGKKLQCFPAIKNNIESANTNVLMRLHVILYGDSKQTDDMKTKLLNFDGFKFKQNSEDWNQKKFLLSLVSMNFLKEYVELLCLADGPDMMQNTMVDRLMVFLMAPREDLLMGAQNDDVVEVKAVTISKSPTIKGQKEKPRIVIGKVLLKSPAPNAGVKFKRAKKKPELPKKGPRHRKELMDDKEVKKLELEIAREERAKRRSNLQTPIFRAHDPAAAALDTGHSQARSMLTMIQNNRALKTAGLDPLTPSNTSRITKLGDNNHVKFMVITLEYEDLDILHNVIYLHDAVKGRIRRNILDFSGFDFDESSEKYKFRELVLERLGQNIVKRIAFIFGLTPLNTDLSIKDLIDLIMHFLMRPTKMKQIPISEYSSRFFQEYPRIFRKDKLFEGIPYDAFMDKPQSVLRHDVMMIKDVNVANKHSIGHTADAATSNAEQEMEDQIMNELFLDNSDEGIPIAEVFTSSAVNIPSKKKMLSAYMIKKNALTQQSQMKEKEQQAGMVKVIPVPSSGGLPKNISEQRASTPNRVGRDPTVSQAKVGGPLAVAQSRVGGQLAMVKKIGSQSMIVPFKLTGHKAIIQTKVSGQSVPAKNTMNKATVAQNKISGQSAVPQNKISEKPTMPQNEISEQPAVAQNKVSEQSAAIPMKISERPDITITTQRKVSGQPTAAPQQIFIPVSSKNLQSPQSFGPPIITMASSSGSAANAPVFILQPSTSNILNGPIPAGSIGQSMQFPNLIMGNNIEGLQSGSGNQIIIFKVTPNSLFVPVAQPNKGMPTSIQGVPTPSSPGIGQLKLLTSSPVNSLSPILDTNTITTTTANTPLKSTVPQAMLTSTPIIPNVISLPSMRAVTDNSTPAIQTVVAKSAEASPPKSAPRAMKSFPSAGRRPLYSYSANSNNGSDNFNRIRSQPHAVKSIVPLPVEVILSDEDDSEVEEVKEPTETEIFCAVRDIIHSSAMEDINLNTITRKLSNKLPTLNVRGTLPFIKASIKKVID